MKTNGRNEPRILIADDDTSIRQLLTTIMKRERLNADSASDGEDAIRKLQEHEYSVILLDLMMPRVDGFGVIDYLAEHPPHHKPVVLVVTAYADQKFKNVDANIVSGVLRKPFEVADLGAVVRLCPDGYIWIGTRNGLARFDGVRFTLFDKSNTPEIRDSEIIALAADHTGTLWIGTTAGLTSLRDGHFHALTSADGIPAETIYSLFVS